MWTAKVNRSIHVNQIKKACDRRRAGSVWKYSPAPGEISKCGRVVREVVVEQGVDDGPEWVQSSQIFISTESH